MAKEETITIGRRKYRKFWPTTFTEPVTDGTVRCIFCGQIDEPEFHENSKCCFSSEWDGVDRQSA
jgi:hypothetical protein